MREGLNRVAETLGGFKSIIAPLKGLLNISFGYMIVFNDGHYYTIVDDTKFLRVFVERIKKSSIFCGRDITSFVDDHIFSIWPEAPVSPAMDVCLQHNLWNGVTVSKVQKDFTELWWFTGACPQLQSFFIRHKEILLKFIHYFNYRKPELFIPEANLKQHLFKFTEGFEINICNAEDEKQSIRDFLAAIKHANLILKTPKGQVSLTTREIECLAMISSGLTAKLAANKMHITTRTVRHYIENIKVKIDIHQKSGLIGFYFDHLKKLTE